MTEYTQGTLIVDFIDPQTKQVFWRGTATDVVNHPESPNTAKLEKVVGQIVDRYPAKGVAATSRIQLQIEPLAAVQRSLAAALLGNVVIRYYWN